MATIPRVTIDDATVQRLLNDPTARRKFPFLSTEYQRVQSSNSKGCRGCNRPKPAKPDYEKMKKSIGQMDVDKKAALRALLNTRQVAVSYSNGRGKKINLKF